MNLHPSRRRALRGAVFLLAGILGLFVGPTAGASFVTLTVTNNADSGPGSLRQAIQDANADPSHDHTILFALSPGTVITPASSLPALNRGAIFQSPAPVTIDGTMLGAGSIGLQVDTNSNGSQGVLFLDLTFQKFGTGIDANSPIQVGNCRFLDCGYGIALQEFSSGSIIGLPAARASISDDPPPPPGFGTGGNLFQRCSLAAIVANSGHSHVMQGNLIGTTPDGTASAGAPQAIGIQLNFCGGCLIGGARDGCGNLIAGLSGTCIDLENFPGDPGCRIEGNYLNCTRLGDAPIAPSGAFGIHVNACPDNLIQRNVILGGTAQTGIFVTGLNATGNTLLDNRIGCDPTGQIALGNLGVCVQINNAPGTTVGAPFHGNFLGKASSRQLALSGGNNQTVQGNIMGTNRLGAALGTASNGCFVSGTTNSRIGGTGPGEGNVILGVNGVAVSVTGSSASVSIRGNSLLQTAGNICVDLNPPAGVNANDAGDGDGGPNGSLNFPSVSSATLTNGTLTVNGFLSTLPGRSFTVDVYASSSGGTNNRQGHVFLGTVPVTTDNTGSASFIFHTTASLPSDAAGTTYITAVSTDTALGLTSEFCQPVAVSTPPPQVDYRFAHFAQDQPKGVTPLEEFTFDVFVEVDSSVITPNPGATVVVTIPPGLTVVSTTTVPGTSVQIDGSTITATSAVGPPYVNVRVRVDFDTPTGLLPISGTITTNVPDSKPQNNSALYRIPVIVPTPGFVTAPIDYGGAIVFPTQAGRRYRVEQSYDLQSWTTVADNVLGTGSNQLAVPIAPPGSKRFFRVVESVE